MEYLVSITALEVAAQVVQPEFAVEVSVGGPGQNGRGVPVGGTAGQVLEKIDGTDYNTHWVDAPDGAVDSVNGQTGVVVLTQDNVGDGTTYKQYSQAEKTKLQGIEAGAQVNVNADWNAVGGDAEILNKPAIPSIAGLATVAYVDAQDALKVDKVAGKSLLADTEISRLASMTAIFTTALQAAYDGAVAWIGTNGAALIAHLSNTSNPHSTTAAQVGAVATIVAGANVTVDNTDPQNPIVSAASGGVTDGDKGDITVSGGGATWQINDNAVELGDIEQIATEKLLGRHTGGSGDVQQVGLDGGLEFFGANIRRSALTGDVTASAGSGATTIAAALKTAWDGAVTWIATNGAGLIAHLSNTSNPHSTTAAQVGLSNVDNTSDLDKPISTATQTALNTKIGGSGTTGTLPKFTGAGAVGDSLIRESGGKIAINGAAFLRALNVYGTGFDARMYFHGPAASNPGIELGTDTTGTRRVLIRLLESGVSGTTLEFYVTPSAGGTLLALQISHTAQMINSFLAGAGTRVLTGTSGGGVQALTNGSDGQVLTLSSGAPAWATPAGGSVYPSGLAPLTIAHVEDFYMSSISDLNPFFKESAGSGAGLSNTFGSPNTGYGRFRTGTTATGRAVIYTDQVFKPEVNCTLRFKSRVLLSSQTIDGTNASEFFFGISDSYLGIAGLASVYAIFLLTVSTSSVSFSARSANGGAAETTSLSAPSTSNYITLEIIITNTASITFFVDGVLVATHTTIPIATFMFLAESYRKTAGTTQVFCTSDFVAFQQSYISR